MVSADRNAALAARREQQKLWEDLVSRVQKIYQEAKSEYHLTNAIMGKLRSASIPVSAGGCTIILRWNSSYAFTPTRRTRFDLNKTRVDDLASEARVLLYARLRHLKCVRR